MNILLDTELSNHDLFFSRLIATKISEAKHSLLPWFSSSLFTDSRINRFRSILQHGPYNLGSYTNHAGFNQYQFGTEWWATKVLFGPRSLSSENHHSPTILTKLVSYKNSILNLYHSNKPEKYPTPTAFSKLDHYRFPGIISTLKRSPYLILSLGALIRPYHNYTSLPLALKNYLKPAQIMRYQKHLNHFIKHVNNHKAVYMVIVTIALISRWETIPYSKRKHFVMVPVWTEKSLGNFIFKRQNEFNILPCNHPHSVRIRSISNQILQALQSDLKIKQMCALELGSKNMISNVDKKDVKVPWWRPTKFSTRHLEGLNWEIVVVDRYIENAYCVPGGKIVVYTGLLEKLKSDAEVATVLCHEVGHAVARHSAETVTKLLFIIAMMIILSLLAASSGSAPRPKPRGSSGSGSPSNGRGFELLLKLILNPFIRRNEREADYIGLLLMASAGYDPREAPKVYKMLDKDDSSDSKFKKSISELFSTHPSGIKRAAALSKPRVMEEATTIFSKSINKRTRRWP